MIRRLLLVFSYGLNFLYHKGIGASERAFDILCRAVGDLGGVYVKLIQFICLRTDIFADTEKIRLLGFYDAVPFEILPIKEILARNLGEKAQQFATLETHPFASGTFGQVYRGTLIDGTDVVVKILRPGLKAKLAFDFFVMNIAVAVFTLVYEQHLIDVKALLSEFETLTYKELDYQEEAKHANYFYEWYRNHPHVVIPKTYEHLTTKTVLVQEYIGGVSVTEILKDRKKYACDLRPIIKELAYELGVQGLTCPCFYADPHPGNIKILPHGKFAFIDFGIVGVSPKNRNSYYHIIKEILVNADTLDTKRVGEEFFRWGGRGLEKHLDVLDTYFHNDKGKLRTLVIDKYANSLETYRERFRAIEAVEEENFVSIYLDIIRAGELLGVKIPDGMLASIRTIAIYKSWAQYLEPDYHCMREVYKNVLSSVDQKYLINADELSPKPVGVEEAMERVMEWVSFVAEKDYAWYNAMRSSLGRAYA